MNIVRLLLVTALLAATALAGCSSSGNAGGGAFTMTAPAAPGGSYAFGAKVTADNYTWDLGDHLTTKYGASITHAYDFKDGEIRVILHARTGKDTKDYSQPIVLGNGKNAPSTFLMQSSSNWTVLGEEVKFSASTSHDPEGDPMRFSWSCNLVQPAVKKPVHTHANFGIPFGSAPAGSVTSGLATGPLPAADLKISGDFCDGLALGTPLSTHATTISGAFAKTGVYDIYLIAADPVHPTTSGSFRLVVTSAADRPDLILNFTYGNTFQGGTGSLQAACDQAMLGSCDKFQDQFTLPLNGLGGTAVFTLKDSLGVAAASFEVTHEEANSAPIVTSGNAPGTFTFNGAHMGIANNPSFKVVVTLTQGTNVEWSLSLAIHIDRDPAKLYF